MEGTHTFILKVTVIFRAKPETRWRTSPHRRTAPISRRRLRCGQICIWVNGCWFVFFFRSPLHISQSARSIFLLRRGCVSVKYAAIGNVGCFDLSHWRHIHTHTHAHMRRSHTHTHTHRDIPLRKRPIACFTPFTNKIKKYRNK